jgi:molybdopterin converting factor small subunit
MPAYVVRYMPTGNRLKRFTTESVSSAEPWTVGELMDHLVRTGALEPSRSEDSHLAHDFLVLVNGRSVHSLDAHDTLLADGDTVSVLLPVAGG